MNKKSLDEIFKLGTQLAKNFIDYNAYNLSPYNAIETVEEHLKINNFIQLNETTPWQLSKGKFYYLKRGFNSSIVAFSIPQNFDKNSSIFKIIGSHSDSPSIRLAPKFDYESNGFQQVCLQMYGGGIWYSWFDRPLSLGGRIVIKKNGKLENVVYISSKPVAKISSMCIHLKNSNPLDIKNETDLKPILATNLLNQLNIGKDGECSALRSFLAKELQVEKDQIVDFDLCFGAFEKGNIFGLYDEFISDSRLDNQYSVFCSMQALLQCKADEKFQTQKDINLIAVFDHEEIGSETYVGANSEYMRSILQRILIGLQIQSFEDFDIMLKKSFLLSCDMAHSVHPNYSSFHQSNHKPLINSGIVLKINCQGRYTTDSISGSVIKEIANKYEIPLQEFIVPCDSRCGTTIGPMLASLLGCLSVDIGAPQLGMHSIRETAGVLDFYYYKELMRGFLSSDLLEIYPKQFIKNNE